MTSSLLLTGPDEGVVQLQAQPQAKAPAASLEPDMKELEDIEAQVLSKLLGLSTSSGIAPTTAAASSESEGMDAMPDVVNLLKGLTQSEGLANDMEEKLDAILAKLDGLLDSLEPGSEVEGSEQQPEGGRAGTEAGPGQGGNSN